MPDLIQIGWTLTLWVTVPVVILFVVGWMAVNLAARHPRGRSISAPKPNLPPERRTKP